ncbi:MAG: PAS domain-containing hybrid sensor histidine kinase/response regulator, partial [Actinomycetota bacterium]
RRLLRDKAGEVSALLTNSFSGIESSMRVLGNVGSSSRPSAVQLFEEAATPLAPGTATIGVAVEGIDGFTVIAAIGDGPAVGEVLDVQRGALAARAVTTGKLVSALITDGEVTRLVLALPVGLGNRVAFQESVIDPKTPVSSPPGSPFHELRVTLYASSRVDPDSLVFSTEAHTPLPGPVERVPFPVGADRWLLVVSSREPLVGSLSRNTPLFLLLGGLITAILASAVAETLARRRAFALAMVAERTRDLRDANEELADARSFLDSVIENIPNMVFVKSSDDLRFVRFNRAGEELLGHSREDLIGKNDYDFFPQDEADFFTLKDREVLDGRTLIDIPEEPVETENGIRILHTKKLPILDESGLPRFLLGISEDITERREADREIREAKDEAERANRAKDEFLSRMSHELRTPLNAVLGFAQVLQMDPLTAEQTESVEQILRGGRHLLALIDEVLDISRISTGNLAISTEPVGVTQAISEAIALVQPLASERGVGLSAEDANGLHVLADHQRLKQVLLNLLSNGVKYNREGGAVRIAWEKAPLGRLRIQVSDTGPGIAPEMTERLFSPFDRLGAEVTGVQGTGLGLALSRGLVEAMGGTLQVETEVGSGSVFTIELALAETPVDRYERERARHPGSQSGVEARTILYVEDNLSNLTLIERILSTRPDISLITALQGRLGIELAQRHHPDLILLDLHLPDISGAEALRTLRELPDTQRIPIVMISADATPGQVKRLLGAGADDYLTKPIDLKRFLEIIDTLVSHEVSA